MRASGFTPGQRLVLLLMIVAVIIVFAMLAGVVITSIRGWEETLYATATPFKSLPPTPLPPTATPTSALIPQPEEGIQSQVQAARLLDQIEHRVESLRGLSPRAEVPLNFLDEREMAALLRQLHVERNPEARLLPYTALGLLPDVSIDIRVHEAAGVYVPEQGQLYVATGRQESSADDLALLAHAYVHALQDQYFDLGAMGARAKTTDATLAAQALMEGDATLLTALYRYEDIAAADWPHLADLILQAEQPGYGEALSDNEVWARLQRFPYWEGREFAVALVRIGGWDGIDHAYASPPRSTEQVLHPGRYLNERELPAHVVVPDLSAVLGEDWALLLQDTLGEFVIGLYLEGTLSEEMAWQAADGWDGDTFVVWEDESGSRVRVWRTIWGSTAEAAEFEHALVTLILQRCVPAWPLDPPRGLSGQWWETGSGGMYVSRVARYVIFVEAPSVNVLKNVVEVLPQ